MTWLIPTIHPAALMRNPRPISNEIKMDLAKANRISQYGFEQEEHFCICHPANPSGIYPTVKEALAWMDRWMGLKCPVAVDVETSALEFFRCDLYSIALAGVDRNTAIAWSLRDYITLPWDAQLALDRKLSELLAHPEVPKIFHNAPYDFAVLTRKGFTINGPIEDTQAYAHLVQPDSYKDLGWIGHTWLDVEPWKLNHRTGRKHAMTKDIIELLVYNAKDALNTAKLRNPLVDEILARGMNMLLIQYQNAFARLAARMELVGMPINFAKRKEMGQVLMVELADLRQRMREYLQWPTFNPMNKNHAVEAIYGRKYIGLTPTAWTPVKKLPSTKYEDLLDNMEHPFIKMFIAYVENHHVHATQYRDAPTQKGEPKAGAYARAVEQDGRLHVKWNPTGQKGSRFSSEPNVQNQRTRDRSWFEAPEGRVFIGSDKDALELRLAAVFSGVRELIAEMSRPGGDPHRLAAVNIFAEKFLSRSPEEQRRLRDGVKTTVYASLYRGGVKTVHKSIRKKKWLDASLRAALTLEVVEHIYHSYFGKYVEIPAWHDLNYSLAQSQGYLEIPPLGRRRYFPVQPPPYTEVANWPIQTAGSDAVGMEMVQVQDELDRRFHGDASIILHGHDAVYIECAERHALDVAKIVNRIFGATPMNGPAGPLALTATAKICKDLQFAKDRVTVVPRDA